MRIIVVNITGLVLYFLKEAAVASSKRKLKMHTPSTISTSHLNKRSKGKDNICVLRNLKFSVVLIRKNGAMEPKRLNGRTLCSLS